MNGLIKWYFIIKYNNNYLLNKFGGHFKPNYETIKLSFNNNKLISFTVGFDTDLETIFFDERYKHINILNNFIKFAKKRKN